MKRTPWVLTVVGVVGCVVVARAWDLKSIDLNKAASASKKVATAAQGISEPEEIAIGKDVADRMAAKDGTKTHGHLNMIRYSDGHVFVYRDGSE